jgi:hypothetical protein
MVRGLGFSFEVFWVYGLWVCGVGFMVSRFRAYGFKNEGFMVSVFRAKGFGIQEVRVLMFRG